jgi:hypothetical protein
MKKYILFALTILTAHMIYAQGISLNPKSAFAQGPNASTDARTAKSVITNNSTDTTDVDFTWSVINFSKPTGWQIDFCDPYDCFSQISSSSSATKSFKLKAGTSNIVKADFYFNETSGNGSFGVIIKSVKNSSNADTVILSASAWVTAVNEVSKTKTVSFYPNPVKDQITIKFPVKEGITVEIYNVLGMRVKSFTHSSATTSVNIGDLQNGVYFLRFTENGKLYTKQFTKAE